MKISSRSRKFHDPWGNKHNNQCGSNIRRQYLVSKSSLNVRGATRFNRVNGMVTYFDECKTNEHNGARFVLGSKVETLR